VAAIAEARRMRILRRYLFVAIAGTTGLVLAVLLSLGAFIEFVGQLNDIGVGRYGLPQAIVWVFLKLPNVLFQMLPVATLLGALLGLGTLAARSELIVLRAAGVSPLGIARAVGVAGLALAALGLVLGEAIGPPLERYARQYRAEAKFGRAGLDTGQSSWIRDGEAFVNVVTPDDRGDGGVFVFRLSGASALTAIGRGDSVRAAGDGTWVIDNYAESRFDDGGIRVERQRESAAVAGLNPDLLGLAAVREETLTGTALWRYARYLKANGLVARPFEVAFWSRIATATAVAVMCVLAVPFVLGALRSGGTGARMLTGLGIGLAWFLASRTLGDGGEVWDLPPIVVAWVPTALLAVATVVALARAR
jgi:lipopolysaccharide export system permease protein